MSHLYQLLQKSAPDCLFFFLWICMWGKKGCIQNPDLQTTMVTCSFLWLSCQEPFGVVQRHTSCWGPTAKYYQPVNLKINQKRGKKKKPAEFQLFLLFIQTLDHSAFKNCWNCDVKEHQLKGYFCWLWLYLYHVSAACSRLRVIICIKKRSSHHYWQYPYRLQSQSFLQANNDKRSFEWVTNKPFLLSVQTEPVLFTASPHKRVFWKTVAIYCC